MDAGLDARTVLTIVGVVVGFFLVPFAMLGYDHHRQQRLGRRRTNSPSPGAPEQPRGRDTGEGRQRRQDGDRPMTDSATRTAAMTSDAQAIARAGVARHHVAWAPPVPGRLAALPRPTDITPPAGDS